MYFLINFNRSGSISLTLNLLMAVKTMKFYYKKLQPLRKRQKITTNTLSEIMGVHRATVWNWKMARNFHQS